MTEHTPGPWTACEEPTEFHETHRPESVRSRAFTESDQMGDYRGVIVCTFAEAHGHRPHAFAECAANARLIAASPDLLAACQIVLGTVGESGRCHINESGLDAVRAAIAKATAQEPHP